jgi:excisionase family DNA binding protein
LLDKEFISTGRAAEICSVTPNAVLKWVKAGKIPASRTPGGHYRIHRQTLMGIIESGGLPSEGEIRDRSFQFCWEYYSVSDRVQKGCLKCIAYRTRAMRCYEMRELPQEAGFAGLFCSKACSECDYFRIVHGQRPNVLILTDKQDLRNSINSVKNSIDFNLAATDGEYQCSMLIENFRPDFVIIDCPSDSFECASLIKHLTQDPRVPYVKIIVSGAKPSLPEECDRKIFARFEGKLEMQELTLLLNKLKREGRDA